MKNKIHKLLYAMLSVNQQAKRDGRRERRIPRNPNSIYL
jgi:hypothetical protein